MTVAHDSACSDTVHHRPLGEFLISPSKKLCLSGPATTHEPGSPHRARGLPRTDASAMQARSGALRALTRSLARTPVAAPATFARALPSVCSRQGDARDVAPDPPTGRGSAGGGGVYVLGRKSVRWRPCGCGAAGPGTARGAKRAVAASRARVRARADLGARAPGSARCPARGRQWGAVPQCCRCVVRACAGARPRAPSRNPHAAAVFGRVPRTMACPGRRKLRRAEQAAA